MPRVPLLFMWGIGRVREGIRPKFLPFTGKIPLYTWVRPSLRTESVDDVKSSHKRYVSVIGESLTLIKILQLHASCLSTEGPFCLLNALRTLNAGATHSLHVSFVPHLVQQVNWRTCTTFYCILFNVDRDSDPKNEVSLCEGRHIQWLDQMSMRQSFHE